MLIPTVSYMAIPGLVRALSPTQILEAVAHETGVTKEQMKSRNRKREFVEARQIAFVILKKRTKLSLSAIGKMLNRDHSTVLHSLKVVEALNKSDKKYNYKYRNLFNYGNI